MLRAAQQIVDLRSARNGVDQVAPSAQRPRCLYPGCTRPARLGEGRGAPPKYCGIDGHGPHTAHRERQRLLATAHRLDADSDPVLLIAEIATLRRENAALRAELDVERHHHAEHHPHCTCRDLGPTPGEDGPGQ